MRREHERGHYEAGDARDDQACLVQCGDFLRRRGFVLAARQRRRRAEQRASRAQAERHDDQEKRELAELIGLQQAQKNQRRDEVRGRDRDGADDGQAVAVTSAQKRPHPKPIAFLEERKCLLCTGEHDHL